MVNQQMIQSRLESLKDAISVCMWHKKSRSRNCGLRGLVGLGGLPPPSLSIRGRFGVDDFHAVICLGLLADHLPGIDLYSAAG